MSTGYKIAGRFRLLKELGSGSVGIVWLAEEELESGGTRLVVVKRIAGVCREELPQIGPRFERARSIRHPGLIDHYELIDDETDGELIVVEYFPHRTLAQVLDRARALGRPLLPLSYGAWIVTQLCAVLESFDRAHPQISIEHIFLPFRGNPKLSGMVPRPVTDEIRAKVERTFFELISPEQLHGERTDVRSNIYSLGVLLWELATGEKCFTGERILELLESVSRHEFRRPSEVCRRVSLELESVILRAMAREPEGRFQTPAELRRAIEGIAVAAPNYVAELFPGEEEAEQQRVARLTSRERRALDERIIADPSAPGPYLVLADWLQQANDPRGELIVLDHALSDAGYVTGISASTLRRELNSARLNPHQRALVEREAELLKAHGAYLVEGLEVFGTSLRNAVWRLGFIWGAMIDTEYWEFARETVAALSVAPSARFLQVLRVADRFERKDYSNLGVWRFECLRSVTRSDSDFSLPSR